MRTTKTKTGQKTLSGSSTAASFGTSIGTSTAVGLCLLVGVACTPQNFASIPTSPVGDGNTVAISNPTLSKATDSFVQDDSGNQVDILIVNDNSLSMYEEQTKLAQRFSSFISELSDVDYHIGMTTTDLESPRFNQDGRLLTWEGTNSTVLTRSTPLAESVFENTVKRRETIESDGSIENSPASNELPLEAMMRAFEQHNTANAGFFREKAPLVLVVLSDEDEASNSPAGSTRPAAVLSKFASVFGMDKRVMVSGIIIRPGDLACQREQSAQSNGEAKGYFGTAVTTLALLTGGDTISICEKDYSRPLAELSRKMRKLVSSFELKKAPRGGVVQVKFTPALNLGYKIVKSTIVFDAPPPIGTRIDVSYDAD